MADAVVAAAVAAVAKEESLAQEGVVEAAAARAIENQVVPRRCHVPRAVRATEERADTASAPEAAAPEPVEAAVPAALISTRSWPQEA
jgi:hypothetical protein